MRMKRVVCRGQNEKLGRPCSAYLGGIQVDTSNTAHFHCSMCHNNFIYTTDGETLEVTVLPKGEKLSYLDTMDIVEIGAKA